MASEIGSTPRLDLAFNITESQQIKIPHDIAVHILSKLTPREIAQRSGWSKQLYAFVNSSDLLKARLTYGECLVNAKKIAREMEDDDCRNDFLKEIVTLEALDYYFEAIATAQTIDPSYLNAETWLKALHDIPKAKVAAYSIQDPASRAQILLEIAKVDGDFSEVKEAARSIPAYLRAQILLEIAEIDRDRDCSEVKQIVLSMQNSPSRTQTLLEIAKVDGDFSEVKEVACSMQDPASRAQILLEIAKVDGDFSEVKEVARSIQAPASRAQILLEIAKIDRDFSEVKKAALLIQAPTLKAQILLEIAQEDRDFSELKVAALQMEHSSSKANILLEIAKADPAHDLSAVKDEAFQIQDPDLKWQTLVEIVSIEALRGKFSEAKVTARQIENPHFRARAFVEIVKIEVFHDLDGAKATVEEINSLPLQVAAWLEIAKVDPSYAIPKAKEVAQQIQSDALKMDALLKIAKVDRDLSAVMTVARKIQENKFKVSTLLDIAKIARDIFSCTRS